MFALDKTLSAQEDVTAQITAAELVANDTDVDGDTLTIAAVSNAVNGTVSLDGVDTVLFTPDNGFYGQAFFDYTVTDGNGGTDTATVAIDVYAPGIDDLIVGTSGADTIDGTSNSDHLIGHDGSDILNGKGGATF